MNNENENVFYLLRKRQWTSWPFAILYSTTTIVIFRNLDFLDAFVILGAVHILVFLLTLWFVDFKCFLQYSRVRDIHHATACKIIMSAGYTYRQLVPLHSRKLPGSLTDEFYFDLHKQRFIYSDGTFVMLPYPSDETFGYYLRTNGHETEAKLQLAAEKWGRNV
ncbi:hypothetical protein Tco_0890467 [Tanacetum coccineum]|uniref:P5A-ATPase transmembrane helical hairpin domain-containing protein n=1 Tax=Tanacetum coccineum TaxID=301880 RepID=A0ABQ5C054_9ASTR